MNILIPIEITDAMFTSSTIAEPDATETAWVSAAAYVVGDLRIRTTTHRVYECVQAHTGRAQLPEVDSAYWLDIGPTLKWAALDTEESTPSTDTVALTMVLLPGFFNAVSLYGLVGDSIQLVTREAPAGAIVDDSGVVSLVEDSIDWYEWLFSPIRQKDKFVRTGIPPSPTAEITITITGATASCGLLAIGDLRPLAATAGGGTRRGAKAEPVTYSYIKRYPDGTTKIERGNAATDMRAEVFLALADADSALLAVQEVLDMPVAFIATTAAGFAGLNVFGLGSGSLSYDGAGHAILSMYVKGAV